MTDIKPAAVYRTIVRLEQAGLVEASGTDREGRRPERTIYGITKKGCGLVPEWLRRLLARLAPEFPVFRAAVLVMQPLAGRPHPDDADRQHVDGRCGLRPRAGSCRGLGPRRGYRRGIGGTVGRGYAVSRVMCRHAARPKRMPQTKKDMSQR